MVLGTAKGGSPTGYMYARASLSHDTRGQGALGSCTSFGCLKIAGTRESPSAHAPQAHSSLKWRTSDPVSCRVATANHRLLDELTLARGDGSYPRLIQRLAKTWLLILDDWGLASLSGQGRHNLLEVLNDRYARRLDVQQQFVVLRNGPCMHGVQPDRVQPLERLPDVFPAA